MKLKVLTPLYLFGIIFLLSGGMHLLAYPPQTFSLLEKNDDMNYFNSVLIYATLYMMGITLIIKVHSTLENSD